MEVSELKKAMRNPTVSSLLLFALVVSLTGRAVQAQQPPPPPPPAAQQPAEPSATTLKMQAREVVLPVTVRDKHGALVSSLKISDFSLTEKLDVCDPSR